MTKQTPCYPFMKAGHNFCFLEVVVEEEEEDQEKTSIVDTVLHHGPVSIMSVLVSAFSSFFSACNSLVSSHLLVTPGILSATLYCNV